MNSFITKNKWTTIVILVLVTEFLAQVPVYADKLYPIDQGTTDPSFKAFREELRAAIKSRDSKFILNSLAPDILVNYGVIMAVVRETPPYNDGASSDFVKV